MALLINLLFSIIIVSSVIMTLLGLPGNLLLVLSGVAYGYYDHFEHMNYVVLGTVVTIFIISEGLEFLSGVIAAKKEQASRRSMIATFFGTVLGGIGGTFVLPIIGSILGAFLGAFAATAVAEYTKEKDREQAKRVAMSVVKGQMIGMLLKFIVAVGIAILLLWHVQW